MKKLFFSTDEFDKKLMDLGLGTEILMENAAAKIASLVRKKLKKGSKILCVFGGGNNGTDGLCAMRRLSGDYECEIYQISDKLNAICQAQLDLALKFGVKQSRNLKGYDCYIDGIFGSGLNKILSPKITQIINQINSINALKIAIDFPSGLSKSGEILGACFRADYTITMGALKYGLYMDNAKDHVGKIKLANLGVSEENFVQNSDINLVEIADLVLPFRSKNNTNKGDFGHVYVVCGQISGAAIIASLAAYAIGAGLVSLYTNEKLSGVSPILMQKSSLENAQVLVAGSGLGEAKFELSSLTNKKCVIDADLCHDAKIFDYLDQNMVLTPHPKEFSALLTNSKIDNVSVSDIQNDRIKFAKKFSQKFPNVLVLKGANTIIAQNGVCYVVDCGAPSLAKGGSGDVLAGIIAGYLAQNFSTLNSAINGVLAHALSVRKIRKNNYSLNALDIIEGIKCL